MRREHIVVGHRLPLSGVRVAPPEAPAFTFRRRAQRLRANLRAHRSVLERGGEAARFARRAVAVVTVVGDHRDAGGNGEDHQDHQNFDQREPCRGVPLPRQTCCERSSYKSHEPISASMPDPPGWPSAPKLNTSISPRTPGLR